jgi:hypothetical protein
MGEGHWKRSLQIMTAENSSDPLFPPELLNRLAIRISVLQTNAFMHSHCAFWPPFSRANLCETQGRRDRVKMAPGLFAEVFTTDA